MKVRKYFKCLIIAFLGWSNLVTAQFPVGWDILGEAAGDFSGFSVSMPDASTVAVGAYGNGGNGAFSGHVRIYVYDGFSWTQKGQDIDGEVAGDYSGRSVSMPDANTVAIGAIGNEGNGADAGHVRIFSWDGTAWVQKGDDIDGEAIGDNSGWSVSMPDASTVAIGAINSDGNGTSAGHVRVYAWDGSAWVQKGADIDGEGPGNRSGYSVSMPDAHTVAIGARYNNGTGPNSGHVRIFAWDGNAWMQKGADIDGEAESDQSGFSVSMPDAHTVAIGAIFNDDNGASAGHVRIYEWDGNAWMQKGEDIDGEAAEDQSGYSVSMPDANTVAIGAPFNFGDGSAGGHVRVYSWEGSAWIQRGNDINGQWAGDAFGWSVSMPNANIVAIGAPDNDGNGLGSGQVRVYNMCTTSFVTDVVTACNSFTWIDGITYTENNNTAYHVLTDVLGCDSVVTLDLTIHTVSDITTSLSGVTITANNDAATYQWLDCDNDYTEIPGATAQSFTPAANGSYAVQLTENACADTSACVTITTVGVIENTFGSPFKVYPNPTSGQFFIASEDPMIHALVIVRNALGQELFRKTWRDEDLLELSIEQEAGLYFVEIIGTGKKAVLKVFKE
jgi:hypothetical protein